MKVKWKQTFVLFVNIHGIRLITPAMNINYRPIILKVVRLLYVFIWGPKKKKTYKNKSRGQCVTSHCTRNIKAVQGHALSDCMIIVVLSSDFISKSCCYLRRKYNTRQYLLLEAVSVLQGNCKSESGFHLRLTALCLLASPNNKHSWLITNSPQLCSDQWNGISPGIKTWYTFFDSFAFYEV